MQLPLDEEAIKLTSFSSDDKHFDFIRCFYCLKSLANFFETEPSSFLKFLIEQSIALESTPWNGTFDHEFLFQQKKRTHLRF